ncbi:FACT complex subunit SSRP1 isoform X1 [Hydra vulgaris]|uniref:FACT complex subunit SSRP1 isoform X1 n=1 Tax=Hydra vulgaris TaxID=6087 RepID=UPI0002B4919F|nr:FACT complex subunit SSRP1 [Hydra vulgaris]
MTDILEFNDVYSLVRGALNPGRLKLNKSGTIFKSYKTGKVDSTPVAEIQSSKWMRVARGFGLKLVLKNGHQEKYHGFKEVDYEKVKEFYAKNFVMELEDQDLSVSGWNWGEAKFKGSVMSFEVENKAAFEIPLQDVSQATTGKNEVTIEFHRNDDAKVQLMEMRFFVPEKDEEDAVKNFHDQIMSKADIIQATGDAIVTFDEVACLTPRGRYSIRVYPKFLQLHGKTYDYKIPRTAIVRLFLLPHQDQRFMFFVISMDPPLRQGNTRYPFLILQFERDEEMSCELNLTEEEIENKYNNKLTRKMSGAVFEIVSRVLKEICQQKITVPGSFKSKTGTSAISCSYKASNGLLYPLEKGFMFVHKPPVYIRFDEISSVNFARGSTTGRTFDFEMDLNNGTVVVFSSLPKDEYTPLFDFVNQKKLRIKNKVASSGGSNLDQMIESNPDEHDAYLQRMKAEGAERDDEANEGDSESESEDEDFNPANEKVESVREEFDSDVGNSTDDEDNESNSEAKNKKRKSEPKKNEPKIKRPKKEEGSSKKKKKDENAPKRPMSAFMLYMNEVREKIKADNPGIAFTDIAKKGGEQWKTLTDKTKWENMAKEAKNKYTIDFAAYSKTIKDGGAAIKDSGAAPSGKSAKSGSSTQTNKKSNSKNIKDMMKSKESPMKKDAYKSKEYIDTSDDDSTDEDEKKKKTIQKIEKPVVKSKPEDDDDDDDGSDSDESASQEITPQESQRSMRSKGNSSQADFQELKELSEAEEDEAEFSGEQTDDDDDDESD